MVVGQFLSASAHSQVLIDIEREPIDYSNTVAQDPVARLQASIDRGEAALDYDSRFGYLPSLLENLGIPVSSQTLVFSQTSFQAKKITPDKPRAIYFNDDTYIGCVQEGEVLEISAVDPVLGAVFYSLDTAQSEHPKLIRQGDSCLQCHSSKMTQGVPGHLVRSVFTAPTGKPVLNAGTFLTDHTSPLSERWGGWYVTGSHGSARHMGNAFLFDSSDPEDLDREAGANLLDLSDRIDIEAYPSPGSDIVALLVLEHQTHVHNLITAANYQARLALELQRELNEMDGKPGDHLGDSTRQRFGYVAEPLLQALLLIEEATLESPIEGTSGFAREFQKKGPFDSRGRSLRELDLQSRLFKIPCSFLIHSEAFAGLPGPLRDHLLTRLWEILAAEDDSGEYSRLSSEDRKAIYEVLSDTLTDVPECWEKRPDFSG
jgi:hypothetical protein